VSENRVLRRLFGSKREEEVGGWRRTHNDELRNLFVLRNISVIKSRRLDGRDMQHAWKNEKYLQCFGWKIECKKAFGTPRLRSEDNIQIVFREIGWKLVAWIHVV
jgi:hypothetical protein